MCRSMIHVALCVCGIFSHLVYQNTPCRERFTKKYSKCNKYANKTNMQLKLMMKMIWMKMYLFSCVCSNFSVWLLCTDCSLFCHNDLNFNRCFQKKIFSLNVSVHFRPFLSFTDIRNTFYCKCSKTLTLKIFLQM